MSGQTVKKAMQAWLVAAETSVRPLGEAARAVGLRAGPGALQSSVSGRDMQSTTSQTQSETKSVGFEDEVGIPMDTRLTNEDSAGAQLMDRPSTKEESSFIAAFTGPDGEE
jgi:hypothetical protein